MSVCLVPGPRPRLVPVVMLVPRATLVTLVLVVADVTVVALGTAIPEVHQELQCSQRGSARVACATFQ